MLSVLLCVPSALAQGPHLKSSLLLFQEPSTWERYHWLILSATLVTVVEALLILGVLMSRAKRRRTEDSLAERLRFERLVADLSAAFINLPTTEVDREMVLGLGRIADSLRLDRVSLWELTEGTLTVRATRFWDTKEAGTAATRTYQVEKFQWLAAKMLRGETILFSRLEDLPHEAPNLKDYYRREGIQSGVVIPVVLDESARGAVGFLSSRAARAWPNDLVKQLRTVAEMCVSALKRKRTEEAPRESEARHQAFLANSSEGIARFEAEQPIAISLPEDEQISLMLRHGYLAECNDALARILV